MSTHFAEVLAREKISLSGVTDRPKLACWRRRVVVELMTPRSPYSLALQSSDDARDRADFLDQWGDLIAVAVDRLAQADVASEASLPNAPAHTVGIEARRTAVLILAALHGGSTLSQLARDPRPLDAALDLALAPFTASAGNSPARTGSEFPTQ